MYDSYITGLEAKERLGISISDIQEIIATIVLDDYLDKDKYGEPPAVILNDEVDPEPGVTVYDILDPKMTKLNDLQVNPLSLENYAKKNQIELKETVGKLKRKLGQQKENYRRLDEKYKSLIKAINKTFSYIASKKGPEGQKR